MMDMTEEQLTAFKRIKGSLAKAVALEKVADPTINNAEAYRRGKGEKANSMSLSNITTAANQIMTNNDVRQFVALFTTELVNSAIMSREEMAERLTVMARANITDLVDFDNTGAELINSETGEVIKGQSYWRLKEQEDMQPGALSAISELTAGKDGLKVKMQDQRAAMKQLAELQGFDAPKQVDVKVTKELSDFYDESDS